MDKRIQAASAYPGATSNPPTNVGDLSKVPVDQNAAFNCSSLAHALPTTEGTRTVAVSTRTEPKPDVDSTHPVSSSDTSDVNIPLANRAVALVPIDIYTKGRYGRTPLHSAVEENDIQKVKDLIQAGADLEAIDNDEETPLHYAAMFKRSEIIDLLLSSGANVHAKKCGGETPLHFASGGGDSVSVEDLLCHGANVNAKNKFGITPLHLAVGHGHVATVELLLSKGADIFIRDNEAQTPYKIALLRNHLSVAELLIAAGAKTISPKLRLHV